MKQICPTSLLEDYLDRYSFDSLYGFDIRPYTSLVRFDPEDVILQEGSEPDQLYFLVSGRAKLYITHKSGAVTLINFLEAPCFIGEMELVNTQSSYHGVTALSTCFCLSVTVSSCRERLLNDVVFLRNLCGFLSRKTLDDVQNYSRNQAYPLKSRLAAFILLTSNHGVYRERHTETAAYLGVSYRHLLYVLAEFVKEGILEKTPHGYWIVQETELRKIAEGQ